MPSLHFGRLLLLPLVSIALAFQLLTPTHAASGTPDPTTSTVTVTQTGNCSYPVFMPDGSGDSLNISVTVRDASSSPIAGVEVLTGLWLTDDFSSAYNLCVCGEDAVEIYSALSARISVKREVTDSSGQVNFTYSHVGGRVFEGLLDVKACVSQGCDFILEPETIDLGVYDFMATSPDLVAGFPICDETDPVDVADLGAWVGGQSPVQFYSDYNCDGTVDVVDLAIWATGDNLNCEGTIE